MENMNPENVLILDYSVDRSEAPLFRRWLPDNCRSKSVYAHYGDVIPDPEKFSYVLHTGSSLSICSEAPFLSEAEEVVRKCVTNGIPQMGVCYGHQLICRALLGPSAICRCPNGLEAGWIDIEMKGSGLDIPGAAPTVTVLQSHFDRVTKIPDTSEIIATNSHTEIQGFIDTQKCLLGTQFHPEFTQAEGNSLFMKETSLLKANGIDIASVLENGPSLAAGKVFFGYFFNTFRNTDKSSGSGQELQERPV